MRKDGAERRTELLRKLVHVGSGFIAITLAWLTWQQALGLAVAALVFNALILPRIGGKALHRAEDLRRGHAFGIIMYPLSVVILTLVFRERLEFVAIGWALMAFGDGMASVIGSLAGRHRLPRDVSEWKSGISFRSGAVREADLQGADIDFSRTACAASATGSAWTDSADRRAISIQASFNVERMLAATSSGATVPRRFASSNRSVTKK